MVAANLALRFVLELAALAAIGLWCAAADVAVVGRVFLVAGGVLAAAIVWGTFCSPRARVVLPVVGKLAVQFAIFAVAAVGLIVTGHPVLAATFAGLTGLNAVLLPDHGAGRQTQ